LPEPVAVCRELVRSYRTGSGEVRALRGVDASFAAGEVTVVAGPSGSGKSSLLRILAGIDRPTSGSVSVDGIRLDRAGPRTLRRLRARVVATVLQRPSDNFFPHLTLADHLALASRARRGRRARIEEEDLLDLLGLTERVSHRPGELSGGEQQRAAFAQAVLSGAGIVVADEPTAELDLGSSAHLLVAVAALARQGITFILSSHDADVIERADVLIRLDHGRVGVRPAGPDRGAASEPIASASILRGGERDAAIEVREVTKAFRRGDEVVRAVHDVSLRVDEGEFVGLVGRSGSGKTTLLNLISGWERPDAGEVALSDGTRVDGSTPWSRIAVLPQRLGLLEELTVRENVEYPARLAGRLDQVADETEALIDLLGLFPLRHRYPRETSVGEQQRVALARALLLAPRLILADEPTGHQDGAHARDMLEAIRRTVARGSSCLAATHSQELLRYLDRVLTMADGQLREVPG
jgi:putative ABC transport system ATP-binding protein